MTQSSLHNQGGQILIEVLIALTIIVLSITASYFVTVVSNELILDKRLSDRAALYANEGLGAVESIRDREWQELVAGNHGLSFSGTDWNFSGTSSTVDGFNRQVIITDMATRTKKIEVRVSWTGFPNISRQINGITHVSNWTEEGLLFTQWLNPSSLGSGDLSPSGNEGQDIAVEGNYAYIAAKHASTTVADLFVFDVSNPASPSLATSINTGSGLHAIYIKNSDTYAYALSENDAAGFKVIDISAPTSPTVTSTLNLPGSESNISLFVLNNVAYVGTKNDTTDEEFIIVDISAPAGPAAVGSLEIGADVNGIFVYGNRAYLATSHNSKELMVVDVAATSSPQELGSYDWTDTEDALSVYVETSARVFLGRERWNSGEELQVLDASNTSSITALGSLEIGDDIHDVLPIEWLAFIATGVSNGELQIANISNLTNPTNHSSFNYPQVAMGIDYEGQYVYVATRSNDALRVVQGE
ncbi:MAG: hypothetical protein A2939_01385 [Parcubacteria group bacterium RIFCSPLOWO2_01_FULL_48_18]|nr:MAG: hypothetical protein A2939_01385 [Parcubacteria group bacterium RIFCSPLOWO2_01_FULL_48_18]OHB22930.1 MAG: hypothetical protein A3J67_00975 [Parcubacteria group bacterium RIFCSPHIGHO2_02_FULL_48_10b]